MKKNRSSFLYFGLSLTVVVLLYMLIIPIQDISMGNNYWYLSQSAAKELSYSEDAMIYKSFESGNYSDIIINPTVIDICFNDNFILAKQWNKGNSNLNFYIINKISDSLYGPFSNVEFLKARIRLNVSKDLTFEMSEIDKVVLKILNRIARIFRLIYLNN